MRSPARWLVTAAALTVTLGTVLLAGGCDSRTDAQHLADVAAAAGAKIAMAYPQEGTLFPPDSVAPTFVWEDKSGSDQWSILVRFGDGGESLQFSSDTARWRPSEEDWKRIKQRTLERDGEVLVAGARRATRSTIVSATRVHIRTSKDEVGDSLFYREVPLPFLSAVQDPSRIRWRFGTIDSPDGPPIVLQNLPVCGNCHSFADNGSTLGLDVDYGNDKGAYAVMPVSKHMVMNDEKIITWADFKREDGELTFGLLSRVSPTGRYVVSTVKDRSVFVAIPDINFSQLFFPIKGILVVYDRETNTYASLPGADDPKYVQTNAAWSPDGESIVFARATAYRTSKLDQQNNALIDEKDVPEFTVDRKPFRYDLYRIPFNGGKGGTAQPIDGASNNGMSNFFPKFSPDGKWIVFCKARSYMLLQPDSELYIVPTAGGAARRLTYNTSKMNSWHSWSSNSRWLVFSSKVNTPYTQLFLTHIDENGQDSPPVLLERFTSADRAANIPEFVKLPTDAIADIREQFLDSYSFLRAGMANEHTGDHKGAERAYRRGLEIEPDNVELHNALGWTLFQEANTDAAIAEFRTALAKDPNHVKSHNNMALALVELGQLEEAASHFKKSLEYEPKAEIYSDLGFILARLGKPDEAVANYRKALELDPECSSAHFNLAVSFVQSGNFAQAETHYREALKAKSTPETHNGLGFALSRQGQLDEAIAEFREAVGMSPTYTPAYNNLAQTLEKQGKPEEAATAYRQSLKQQPSAAVHNDLGLVLLKMNRKDEAAAEFRKAIALDAGNQQARRNLKSIEEERHAP